LTLRNDLNAPARISVSASSTRWLAMLAMAVALGACTTRAGAGPPHVILIVVDTLRADRLGVYGNPRGLTPFLDELAGRGTVFLNAYSPSSWTCPSVASLFTSRYSTQHRVVSFESKLADDEVTLGELLAQRGYVGGGFSANFRMTAELGYGQGFAYWQAFISPPGDSKARGDFLRQHVVPWLQTTRAQNSGSPVFLYLQYMETHAPYDPREPYRTRFQHLRDDVDLAEARGALTRAGFGMRNLTKSDVEVLASMYDGEVASVDEEIRLLLAALEPLGMRRDNTIVIVTADHGEEFGEHGELVHGVTLFEPAIRVPWIIVAPGFPGGRVVYENVSLLDLAPTLLDLLEIARPTQFEGRSLAPLMLTVASQGWWSWLTGRTVPARSGDVITELEPAGKLVEWRSHRSALISGAQKVVTGRKKEPVVYDLARDPGEQSPQVITPEGDGPQAALLRTLQERQAALKTGATNTAQTQPLDDATKEKLRALGYHP
jgi:arylsulfatase A-like enzyme